MNRKDPFSELESFYQSLDAIPTPPLVVRRPPLGGHWAFVAAPFGAVVVAYLFVSFCAAGPTTPAMNPLMRLSIDRYASEEMRSLSAPRGVGGHASAGNLLRSSI